MISIRLIHLYWLRNELQCENQSGLDYCDAGIDYNQYDGVLMIATVLIGNALISMYEVVSSTSDWLSHYISLWITCKTSRSHVLLIILFAGFIHISPSKTPNFIDCRQTMSVISNIWLWGMRTTYMGFITRYVKCLNWRPYREKRLRNDSRILRKHEVHYYLV